MTLDNDASSRDEAVRGTPGDDSVATGVLGLDTILGGGFPAGRPSVIRASSGCGKTILALLFAQASQTAGSPAVFASFDEAPAMLEHSLKALGYNPEFQMLDFRIDPNQEIAGDHFELGGLLVRLDNAVKRTNAKVVVLDAIDALFSVFAENAQIRRDLERTFEWCRARGITLLTTSGEPREYRSGTGVIDYVADCALHLEQRMEHGLMTRTLKVIKCRGRSHGTNEYPYIIDGAGISLIPITSTTLAGGASLNRLSTGNPTLDDMLGGQGFWEGSAVLVSGQSGTGKSLLATTIAAAVAQQNKRVLYCSFEEAPDQLVRDVASIGLNLHELIDADRLSILSQRSVEFGIEEHIIRITRSVLKHAPDVVVFDPISALRDLGSARDFKSMVLRLCHFLKGRGITAIMTELIPDDGNSVSALNISSIIDTWIKLRRVEQAGTLSRLIHVEKSRGGATSPEIMSFLITVEGMKIEPAAVEVAASASDSPVTELLSELLKLEQRLSALETNDPSHSPIGAGSPGQAETASRHGR